MVYNQMCKYGIFKSLTGTKTISNFEWDAIKRIEYWELRRD